MFFLPLVSAAAGLASAGLNLFGSSQASQGYSMIAEGQKKQAESQLEMEKIRHRQMILDFSRARRETIRQSIAAQSLARTSAVAQGAEGDSSALSGFAGVMTQAGRQRVQQRQNREIGNDLFAENKDYYRAGIQIAEGQGLVAQGQGLQGLASGIGGAIGALSRLGTLAFG